MEIALVPVPILVLHLDQETGRVGNLPVDQDSAATVGPESGRAHRCAANLRAHASIDELNFRDFSGRRIGSIPVPGSAQTSWPATFHKV